MTVGELIKRLGRYDANLPVVIYEDTEMGDRAEVRVVEFRDGVEWPGVFWYNRASGSWDTKHGEHVWLEP